jgi:hypothetical protein
MAEVLDKTSEGQRERLLRVLSATTFLIFFQDYSVCGGDSIQPRASGWLHPTIAMAVTASSPWA